MFSGGRLREGARRRETSRYPAGDIRGYFAECTEPVHAVIMQRSAYLFDHHVRGMRLVRLQRHQHYVVTRSIWIVLWVVLGYLDERNPERFTNFRQSSHDPVYALYYQAERGAAGYFAPTSLQASV
jgi:hypothetical protein